tara:strand:- start:1067 stop:1339 length:273 start_codon:yes stop_codon:yes gene_type:complete
MQTIITKYLPATDTRDSLIKATTSSGHKGSTYTVGWDHSLNVEGNHTHAAQLLLNKLGWQGKWRMGGLTSGYVFVNTDASYMPLITAEGE